VVDRVAGWRVRNFSDTVAPVTGWVHAAFFKGLEDWAALTKSGPLYGFLIEKGREQNWDMLPRVYDADDLCIGQTYFSLYDKYRDTAMIRKVIERVDYVMAHPDHQPLITESGKYYRNRWGWCDALFMAPPVYAAIARHTGEMKYLDFCLSEFKVTTDSLYDKSDKLYYRDLRFIHDKGPTGKKVFWARGNGWVYAGLAMMLELVPRTHSSYNYYEKLFLDMTGAILACQDKEGAWHSSLLEPGIYPQPENSAGGFFVFGLARGLNLGILKGRRYRRAATLGWWSLNKYVHKDGKLGYIQPIGHAPLLVGSDMTAPYGVGAYLLAAAELSKLKR